MKPRKLKLIPKPDLGVLAGIFFIAMALFPQSVYSGARQGLNLWAQILVPSMLPYFILAEILMNSGSLEKIGKMLSPIMWPIFRLPGPAGLGLALGYSSGFPMGAVVSNRLYEAGYLDRRQASQLLAFTNNASPGFLLTSVAAGMLQVPAIGGLLALCHYGANLVYGCVLGRLLNRRSSSFSKLKTLTASAPPPPTALKTPSSSKSFSVLVTESIHTGIQSMLVLGGYILIFSAGIRLLQDLKLLWPISVFFRQLLPNSLSSGPLSQALAAGLFEMTLGLNQISQIPLSLADKTAFCLIILGWSGFSIQAQVAGMVGSSKLQIRYYLLGRLVQPLLSIAILSFCLYLLQFSF